RRANAGTLQPVERRRPACPGRARSYRPHPAAGRCLAASRSTLGAVGRRFPTQCPGGPSAMTARHRLVRVPASSANLGPGYDAMAAAVALHLELEVEETGE